MAGEFLLRNFDIEKDEDKKKKGSYLLDNFKIDPVQAKPASNPKTNTYGPMQTSKTNALSAGFYQPKTGGGGASTALPTSKAGAHRARGMTIVPEPRLTGVNPGTRPTSLLKEQNKARADSIKAGGKALGYGLANTKWLANSAKAIDDWAAEHLFYGNHNELLKAWYESDLEAAKVLEDDLQKDIDEGKINPITSQLMQGTGSAVQTAIIAGMSGGMGSAAGAGTAATGTAAPSTAKIAAQSAVQLAKNPTFLFSATRSFGNAYEEAVNGGADTDTAIRAALLQAVPEAIIEVSGGTEKLVSQLADKTKGMGGSVLRSALEEGLEEILQYPFAGLAQKATYAPEIPLYSTTQQAVINPKDQLSSAVMGAAVGGLIGGGAKAVDAIANNHWAKNDPILQSLDWNKGIDKAVDAGYNQVGGELNVQENQSGRSGNDPIYPDGLGRIGEGGPSDGPYQTNTRTFELPGDEGSVRKVDIREIDPTSFNDIQKNVLDGATAYEMELHFVDGGLSIDGQWIEIPPGQAIVYPDTGRIFAAPDVSNIALLHEVYHPLVKRFSLETGKFSRLTASALNQNSPVFKAYWRRVNNIYGQEMDFNSVLEEFCADAFSLINNDPIKAKALLSNYFSSPAYFDRVSQSAQNLAKMAKSGQGSVGIDASGNKNNFVGLPTEFPKPTLPEDDPILQSLSWKDVPEDFDTLGAMRTAKRPGDLTFDLEPGEVERGFSQNIRSDRNMPNEIRQSFGEDPLLYKQIGNPTTLKKANEIISEYGYEGARAELYKMLGQNVPNPESVPLAKLLARQANELGDIQAARRMLAEVADKLTQAGQFTQAARILREADAETVITTLDKQLKRLNEQGRKQYKKKWKDFDLTPDELNQIRKIKPGDEQAVAAAMENVRSRIADQMPASMGEKFDAWRKMAMLLNPVTHIRNVTSNAFMTTLDKTSSRLSGLMQKLLPKAKRTRAAVVGREYKQLAKEVFDNNAKDLLEQSSRFDELRIHMPDRRIFNSVLPQEFTIGGHKIYNPVSLENIRKFSYASLEAGDTPFFKLAYVDRLASYMQAKGIKDINAIPQEGFDLALRGAQEATFKDPSKIASWIAKSKQTPGIGRAVDTVLPFSKTPVAIANRGMEYSPLGLVQSLYKAVSGQGAAEALDKMAKGLTGSALFGLGMLLYDSGVITAGISADKDKREFEKSVGISPYSILGKFSYDWAQPFAIPIAAGAATMKSLQENNVDTQVLIDQMLHAESAEDFIRSFGIAVDEIPGFTAAKAGMDVLLDQPLLQAAQEFSGRMGTGVSDAIFGLPGQYVEQMIPSVMNRIAGFADPTIRATKDTSGLSTFYNTVRAKTPGISASLPEKRDVWGEIQTRVTDPKLRFLQQFVSPSNLNVQSASPLDEEIMRLYDTTGSSGVFPSYKNKPFSFTTGDGVYEVGYRELPEYQEIFGTTARQISENLMAEELYQKAQEDRKAYLLEQAYKYADAVAKAKISGTSLEGWVKEANEAQKAGIPLDTYLIQREKYSSLPTDETAKSQRYREMLLNDNTLTAKQKAELDKRLIGSKTTPDYTNADTFQFSFLTDAEKSAYAALQASNMDMSTFLWLEDGLKDVKGSKDRNGKTISGSLKQNRYDKLIRMGVTPQEASYYLKVRYNYKE